MKNVIVRKFFKGSWVSEVLRKEYPEVMAEDPKGPPERMIPTAEKRRDLLRVGL